jgi:hypothetical protein
MKLSRVLFNHAARFFKAEDRRKLLRNRHTTMIGGRESKIQPR